MKALILGHGYTAGFLTPRLRDRGWQVTGTTRDAPDRVRAAGATPLLWPGDADGVRRAIAGADAILISAGPDQGGDPDIGGQHHGGTKLDNGNETPKL